MACVLVSESSGPGSSPSWGQICVLGRNTLLSQCLSPPMCVNGFQRNHYIKFPMTIAEITECIATFERTRSQLPNVAGAIDGTHIPIIAPREDAVDYFSRYQQHDMIVQGVVDGTGKFLDASCRIPWECL